MDEYELRVLHFLTENGVSFVCPHMELAYEADIDSGGSKPDFIVIRPSMKECLVVEVTTSGSPSGLCAKMCIAEKQWMGALRRRLLQSRVIGDDWSFKMLAFCRSDKLRYVKDKLAGKVAATIWPIEYTLEHWKWDPAVRKPDFDFSVVPSFCPDVFVTDQERTLP